MSLMWIVYLIDALSPAQGIKIIITCLSLILVFASVPLGVEYTQGRQSESFKKALGVYKKAVIVLIAMIFYVTLVPSKETAYKMLAAYGVEKVAENPDVRRLAGKSLDVLEKAMDSYVKDSKAKE